MFFIRRYEQYVPCLEWDFLPVAPDAAGTIENVNFMFVGMAVQWCLSVRGDFKEPHRKILSAVAG